MLGQRDLEPQPLSFPIWHHVYRAQKPVPQPLERR